MRLVNSKQHNPHAIFGSNQPEYLYGTDAITASGDFLTAAPGSVYHRIVAAGHVQRWVKTKNDLAINDWGCEYGALCYTVLKSAFTDGGSTSGTYDLPSQLPAGAKVKTITVSDVVAFSGDTSATLIVGVTGVDTDQFNTGTPSIFTTQSWVDMGPPSGDAELEAATTVTLLVTSGADFTNVASTGSLTIRIPYQI